MPLDRRMVMACVVAAVAVAALPAGTGSANTVEAWPPPGVWFTPGSFWNQPHDADHRSPNSDRYIADLKDAVCAGHPSDCFVHLSGTSGDAWGSPFYDGSTQPTKRPVVCSDPQGDCHGFPPSDTFWLHLPADTSNTPPTFKPSNDSDSVMVVIDPSPDAGYVVWLHHACPPGRYGTEFCASNGSRDWTADSMSIYSLTSDGLEGCWPKQYPDDFPVPPVGHSDEDNNGHRGFPGAYSGVRWSDAVRAGRISHVLKIAVPDTASAHFFPYVNDEGGSGTIPEGSLIRIKSGIDLTLRKYQLRGPSLAIAQALQTYGAIVGDQGGNGSPNLKVENLQAEGSPSTWADVGIDPDSLSEIPLDAYEFAAGGEWGPHPHASLCNGALDPER